MGLGPEQRRGYEAYMEARVLELGIKAGRKELEANWQSLRRGWYVGSDDFRQGLLARAETALRGKRRESHAVAERRLHEQGRAEDMLAAGLGLLKLETADLAALPKGQREKQVLAWWLYGHTTVKRRWLAEKLSMGYETRVSQAVNQVETSREPAVMAMKNKLRKYGV